MKGLEVKMCKKFQSKIYNRIVNEISQVSCPTYIYKFSRAFSLSQTFSSFPQVSKMFNDWYLRTRYSQDKTMIIQVCYVDENQSKKQSILWTTSLINLQTQILHPSKQSTPPNLTNFQCRKICLRHKDD